METLNRSNNTLYYIKVVGLSDSNAFNDQKRMGVDMCVVKLILNSEEIHNNSRLPVIGIGLERAQRRGDISVRVLVSTTHDTIVYRTDTSVLTNRDVACETSREKEELDEIRAASGQL